MPAFTDVNLATAAAIFVVGLLAGALLARLLLPSRRRLRELVSALDEARTELVTYRANVSDHFEKTSELVATMTASYKAVYDHLAVGARTLCQENDALGVGRFAAPRLVLDQDVAVGATNTATSTTPSEEAAAGRTDAPGRANAPILEMQREQSPAAESTARPPLDPAGESDAEANRSPLH